jgi:hypothetical protein
MEKPFLQIIAEDLLCQDNTYRLATTVIFPSERACSVFRRFLLSAHASSFMILPKILSITDFVAAYSDKVVASELYAVGMLYKAYQQCVEDAESFDKFYPWGKILLRDFDEIDKNLSPAKKVFAFIDAQKSIEEDFALPEEAQKVLQQFFGSAFLSDHAVKQSFIKIWQVLYPIYHTFGESLAKEGYTYTGYMYRHLVENISQKNYGFSGRNIYFCGFNALTRAEERLIDLLSVQANVHLYWDADLSYLNDEVHEAGLFLRLYKKMFSAAQHHWISNNFLRDKDIQIIGAGSLSIQHAFVTEHIRKLNHSESIAIVLCEERALQNLMAYMTDDDYNITMGVRIQDLPIYAVITKYFKVITGIASESVPVRSFIDLIGLDNMLQTLDVDKKKLETLESISISANKPYLSFAFIEELLASKDIFLRLGLRDKDTMSRISGFFNFLAHYEKQIFDTAGIMAHLNLALQDFLRDFLRIDVILEDAAFILLLDKYLKTLSIPLDTKTDANKQIMGLLETRLLDFKHLYLLNVNEGVVPKSSRQYSFIPYNIKMAYDIPTHKDYDALFAYHFYRLLHRAENICLLYQTSDKNSEPSRYLLQLEHEFSQQNNILHTQLFSNKDSMVVAKKTPITIAKTPEIIEKLKRIKFSATALQLYCICPVEFFYKYIAKIREPEEAIECTDDLLFGQLFHSAIEFIYKPYVGKNLPNLLKKSLETLDSIISEALQYAYHASNLQWDIAHLEGKNALDRDILTQLLKQVILKDTETANGEILHALELKLEKTLMVNNHPVILTGTLDRIDCIDDKLYRVIDYKTGKVSLLMSGVEKNMDDIFSMEGKYDLQGYMYAYLLGKYPVDICFYDLTRYVESVCLPPITIEVMQQFEENLKALLTEILDIQIPFVQQPKMDVAQRSAYAMLLT